MSASMSCATAWVSLPDKDSPIVVHCAVGLRAHVAARILAQRGWSDVRNLSGGYTTWRAGTAA